MSNISKEDLYDLYTTDWGVEHTPMPVYDFEKMKKDCYDNAVMEYKFIEASKGLRSESLLNNNTIILIITIIAIICCFI